MFRTNRGSIKQINITNLYKDLYEMLRTQNLTSDELKYEILKNIQLYIWNVILLE